MTFFNGRVPATACIHINNKLTLQQFSTKIVVYLRCHLYHSRETCFIHFIQLFALLWGQLWVQIGLLSCWSMRSLARCSCVAVLVRFYG